LYTFIFVGEDPALGNILATILESRPESHFASCEVLSPQTPKFELKIQLRHEADSEDEQRAIVHELITGALGVLLGQVGLRAHRFHDQWIEYSESQEDYAATVSSMEDGDDNSLMEGGDDDSLDDDSLEALENLLFGTPGDDDEDQSVMDFDDINPPDAVAEGLGGLFSLGANLAMQAIPGNVARPGIHYDRDLNYTAAAAAAPAADDHDAEPDNRITRTLTMDNR
jgi:DNA-directed RNA polymerase subunit L